MAIVLKDRVKETTTTTGTGTLTLLGAVSGYQAFSVIGDGNTTYYAIYNSDDGSWEVGIGTYTASGMTLSRDTVLESSNAGSLVNFSAGAKDVFITYPAEKAIYEEPSGNTLIDGGPITVIGENVTSYTTFSAALGEMYGDVNNYAQLYVQNLNDGSDASSDFAAYNDQSDGETFFVDMGVSSSNASPAGYPILTPNSSYVLAYGDGGSNPSDMFIGSGDGDLNLFAGGFDNADIGLTIDKTTKGVGVVAALDVGGALDVTGAATFGSTVLLDADPTLALQAATKQYVDNAVSNGFHVHTPVLVATTANLTATYSNGSSGVGATLTNSGAQAALSVDGVSMATNDRVLVWSQSTQAQNGVYVVTTVGDGSTNWVLTRASDADTYTPQSDTGLGGGDYFFVQSGSTYGFSSFVCTNDGTITFGTTAITFQLFSTVPSYVVQAPLNLTGNTLSLSGTVAATNGGTGTATVTTGDLLYGSGTNTWAKLGIGSAYKSLVVNGAGTNVEWNAVALNQSGAVSGSLGATNGGTGQSAYTVGDILYSGVTDTLSKLAGNTTTTKKFLTQTGTGAASDAPAWGTISGSDVTSAVSTATNLDGGAANRIPYQTGSGTTSFITAPSSSGTFLSWNGSSFAWAAGGGDAGMVAMFAMSSAPSGWLKANGAAVSRTTYSALFTAIGTTFGAGDGSTTFNLPDMRGYFPRAWDDGAGRDSGRVFGSTQTDAIRNIVGYLSRVGNQPASPYGASFSGALYAAAKANCGGGGGGGTANNCGDLGFDASRSVPTAGENRPINLALLACIKY